MDNFIAIDVETDGLSKKQGEYSHIIQIGAVLFNGEDGSIITKKLWNIKPPVPLDDDTVLLTGITNEYLKDAPTDVKEVLNEVKKFCLDMPLVVCNKSFFTDYFIYYANESGIEFSPAIIDIFDLIKAKNPYIAEQLSVKQLLKLYGVKISAPPMETAENIGRFYLKINTDK